ncbi:MAG TPA: polyamine aminopropyltransferase [Bacillaceae bacterium]
MEKYPDWIQEINGELWLAESDRGNLQVSYRLREVVFFGKSPFQQVMIADSHDFGRMLILDGVVQTTALDGHIYNEMIAHVPLLLHKNPEKVLIIGGGDCGAAREAAKHPSVHQIDMVEIDELVVKAAREHLTEVSGGLSDPRVSFIFTDGIEFARHVKNQYDVIIIDSSDPEGPAEQLFELDFYKNLKSALKEGGILVCQSQSPLFQPDITKKIHKSFESLFPFAEVYGATIPTYPGSFWSFTLGSLALPADPKKRAFPELYAKYFSSDILESCFHLPPFLEKRIKS